MGYQSQVQNTQEKVRQADYKKIYDNCYSYFVDFLGDNPNSILKVRGLVDARFVKNAKFYQLVKDDLTPSLTPEERRAAREVAFVDALLDVKIRLARKKGKGVI